MMGARGPRRTTDLRTLAFLGCLAAAAGVAQAGSTEGDQPPAGPGSPHPLAQGQPACSLEQLAAMPWAELERLYRDAAPGAVPDGFARGRVVYPPCEQMGAAKAHAAGLLWRGKHFCAADGTLVNQWLGGRAIRARVAYGPSWLDGRPSIILDYSGTSRRWADVRDEMREVAPGLYVGAMYLRRCPEPRLKLLFVLQLEPGGCQAGPPAW
jgi:hypothetical protein